MGTVPVQRTWVTGEIVTAAEMNSNIRDSVNFLLARPRCVLTRTTETGWASGTVPFAMTFQSAVVNSDNMWGSPASRMVAKTPGLFEFSFYSHWEWTSAIGTHHGGIALNTNASWFASSGSLRLAEDTRTGSNNAAFGTSTSVTVEQFMNVNDYVEFFLAITVNGGDIKPGQFSIQAVGQWVASS